MLIEGSSLNERSITTVIPTRDSIHGSVYASHIAITWPLNCRREAVVLIGMEVAHAYNVAMGAVLEQLKTKYILTLEDDIIISNDVVSKLLNHLETHPELGAVSALYNTKVEPPTPLLLGNPSDPEDCAPIIPPANSLVEVNIIPMGCALWRTELFNKMPTPWFKTTDTETQDLYFCRNARRRGHRFAVDTGLLVGHRDSRTGKIF